MSGEVKAKMDDLKLKHRSEVKLNYWARDGYYFKYKDVGVD